MTVTAAPLILSKSPTAAIIVAFLEIAKAPKLLASLAFKMPADILPMPVARLSALCGRAANASVALSGVVVCVPEAALAEEERAIVADLAQRIPVLRVFEDPKEAGLTFFDRCREAASQALRSADRLAFQRPVVVARSDGSGAQRLLSAENVAPGGLFLRDPSLSCHPDDELRFRFPGLAEVPELRGRVRWVREESRRRQRQGYGCAFDTAQDFAVTRLLSGARSLAESIREPPAPLPRRPSGRRHRR